MRAVRLARGGTHDVELEGRRKEPRELRRREFHALCRLRADCPGGVSCRLVARSVAARLQVAQRRQLRAWACRDSFVRCMGWGSVLRAVQPLRAPGGSHSRMSRDAGARGINADQFQLTDERRKLDETLQRSGHSRAARDAGRGVRLRAATRNAERPAPSVDTSGGPGTSALFNARTEGRGHADDEHVPPDDGRHDGHADDGWYYAGRSEGEG